MFVIYKNHTQASEYFARVQKWFFSRFFLAKVYRKIDQEAIYKYKYLMD